MNIEEQIKALYNVHKWVKKDDSFNVAIVTGFEHDEEGEGSKIIVRYSGYQTSDPLSPEDFHEYCSLEKFFDTYCPMP